MSSTATTIYESTPGLIEAFLERQRALTPVERFARHKDDRAAGGVAHARPAQERFYRDLIPLTKPAPGEQYAFDVDLDACSGCKACVTACHQLNGLDDEETWRDVGLLVGGTAALPVIQHVTSACHHCVEPACQLGCPVLAYEKDPVTGIVRHLDDQCIGCQYCVLKCPYDVPKYNKSLGIVRKCDMCSGRLAEGEAPACVQACPNQAIRITVVNQRQMHRDAESNAFLPGAPDPDYTLPTTRYRAARALPRNLLAADHFRVAPQHAHWSLVFMLVMTQLSVGAFVVGQVLARLAEPAIVTALRPLHAVLALGIGMTALAASVLHLGRPMYAFRAVIGLRTSWLSREIVAFALFSNLAISYATGCWLWPDGEHARLLDGLGVAVAITGVAAVACSVMVYHDTRRPFWHARYTGVNFFLTTLLLGTATLLVSAVCTAAARGGAERLYLLRGWGAPACTALVALSATKLLLGLLPLRHARDRRQTPMKRTAHLLCGPLLRPMLARNVLTLIGGVLLPLVARSGLNAGRPPADFAVLVVAAFVLTVIGELMARYLFFTAVVAPRMPGGLGE